MVPKLCELVLLIVPPTRRLARIGPAGSGKSCPLSSAEALPLSLRVRAWLASIGPSRSAGVGHRG